MPVSTDSLVLADFVELQPGQRIVDLGSGTGAVALTLAGREKISVVGFDNCMEAVEEAQRRLERDKSLLVGTCRFEAGDLRNEAFVRSLGVFDQVVCNPPYYKVGHGRLPPNPSRASARFETTCTLDDVVCAASWALAPGGAFSFTLIPARLGEALSLLTKHGFAPNALQPVYTRRRRDAERVLIRAALGVNGSLRLLPPRQLRALSEDG